MALDKATLNTSIQTALNAGIGVDDSALQISTDIANAIDVYVKSGAVVTDPITPFLDSLGLPVTGQGIVT